MENKYLIFLTVCLLTLLLVDFNATILDSNNTRFYSHSSSEDNIKLLQDEIIQKHSEFDSINLDDLNDDPPNDNLSEEVHEFEKEFNSKLLQNMSRPPKLNPPPTSAPDPFQTPSFGHFTCPSVESLETVPKNCPEVPRYYALYNSSIMSVTPPRHPGPSEQMHALRDVLMATIQLRKKFAITRLTTHKHDELSKNAKVPMGVRVNLETLCQYVNLVPEPTGEIDTIVYMYKSEKLDNYIMGNFKKYLRDYSNGLYETDKTKKFYMTPFVNRMIPRSPTEDMVEFFRKNGINYSGGGSIILDHAIDWIYASTVEAIDRGGVYRAPSISPENTYAPNMKWSRARNRQIDLPLIKDVYRATGHPLFIQQLAQEFLQLHGITPYNFIGIHFRYNVRDFFGKDLNLGASGRKMDAQTTGNIMISLKYPPYFLKQVIQYANRELVGIGRKVFIASPYNIAEGFASAAGRNHFVKGYEFYTTKDSTAFLEAKRSGCEVIDTWFGEVMSEFEKEILIYAKAYFRSRPSNWSFNVQGHRTAHYETLEDDRYTYDLFKKDDGKIPSIEELKELEFVDDSWLQTADAGLHRNTTDITPR